MSNDETAMLAGGSAIGQNVDSVSGSQIMPSAHVRFLAFRVQHDLACIDMDEAARSRLNDLISAFEIFASVINDDERQEYAQLSLTPQKQGLTTGECG
jgi:hypothetical protein